MDSVPASRQPAAWRAAGPAFACALVGVVLWQCFGSAARGYVKTASLFWWWASQWFEPGAEAEHGPIIVAVSAWLFWRNLRMAEATSERSAGGNWPSAIAMFAGLALHAIGFVAQQGRVSIVALLIFAWGVLRLGGGRRWGNAAMFPLAFLVFAIPVNVLDSAGFWLRMGVVRASAGLAHALGIDVLRNGTQLLAPDGRYQYDVVAACSGVRSLTALVALAALLGYLSFKTWTRRAVVLLLCVPLVYLGNVVRLAAIVFAAQLGGQGWGERAHDVMGFGVFAIVLGGLWLAVRAMGRWWREPESRQRGAPDVRSAGIPVTWLALAIVVLAVAEMTFLHHVETLPPRGAAGVVLAADGNDPVELPTFLGTEWAGKRVDVTAVEREILPADTGFSRKVYVSLANPKDAVLLSIVLSGRDRTSIHRPEVCLVAQGWTITGASEGRFVFPANGDHPATRFPATLLRVLRAPVAGKGTKPAPPQPQLVAYWFVNADDIVATHGERFVRDAWNRVAHARVDRWAYVLMQTDASDGEAAALARMQAVLDGTLPAFQRPRGQPWPSQLSGRAGNP